MAYKPQQVLIDRYRIVSLLGQGGMGAVYRAWDLRLNIPVAVKEMVPQPGLDRQTLASLTEQFTQEAKVLARLNHPHLVRVTDYFEIENRSYLVMDFVDGESLAERIKREGSLSEALVLDWAEQLLDALSYCHSQGILHRDVKPTNVIIRPDGRVVLVDFGLVKLWDPHDPRTKTAMRGMGTPEYAPPEQYDMAMGHTDPASDIYSLGATLYHALTGEAPPTATLRIADPTQMTAPRSVVPNVSRQTEQAVLKAVELNRSRRWQNAEEMASALKLTIPDWGAAAQTGKQTAGTGGRGGTRVMGAENGGAGTTILGVRPVWVWGLVIVAILALGGGGVALLGGFPGGREPMDAPTKDAGISVEIDATDTPRPTERPATDEPTATSTATATPEPTETPAATSTSQAQPSPSPSPTPTVVPTTPRPTATSTPVPATAPVPLSPAGGQYPNPIIFIWSGALNEGQSYRVVATHVESGRQVQSGSVQGSSWQADIPGDAFGEWRWQVQVLDGGESVAQSAPTTFFYNPFPADPTPVPPTREN
ncbi:MAG: serine/threonine-protein kinase [Anaerolineae bacterium]